MPSASVVLATVLVWVACSSDTDRDNTDVSVDIRETTADTGADDGATQEDGDEDISGLDDAEVSTSDGESDTAPTTPIVTITVPADGATVSGAVRVRLEPVGQLEREVDEVSLELGGVVIFRDTKLPTEIVLDTRQHPPGSLTLEAFASDGDVLGADRIGVVNEHAPIYFREVTGSPFVNNGGFLMIEVQLDAPPDTELRADLSGLDSGWAPGAGVVTPIGPGRFAITEVLSADNTNPDGLYPVEIHAESGSDELVYGLLQVRLLNRAIPLVVDGGLHVEALFPSTGSAPPPVVTGVSAIVLAGGVATFSAEPDGTAVALLIGIEGATDYYHLPLAEPGPVPVVLTIDPVPAADVLASGLALKIASIDGRGQVSSAAEAQILVSTAGVGDVEITLAWDTPTDVDLHVIDPFGCELYYDNKDDIGFGFGDECRGAGGQLDIDSNSGCGLDRGYVEIGGKRLEHVFWPPGKAPPGEYQVKVDYWSACNVMTDTRYIVTAAWCGKSEVFEGTFTPDEADGGEAGSGRLVTTFDTSRCNLRARGRVRYHDRILDQNGPGAVEARPLGGVGVELRSVPGGVVLGTAVTAPDGSYHIQFDGSVAGVLLAVASQSPDGDPLHDIAVLEHPDTQDVKIATSLPVQIGANETEVVLDLDIAAEQGAGAFNMFDVLRTTHDRVRLATGLDLGRVRVIADRNLYDDVLIARELIRIALAEIARDSHPGGVGDGTRDEPARAWSEGVATFLAADALATRWVVDIQEHGVSVVDDLDTMPSPFARGIVDGELSPNLVAAFLWDLGAATFPPAEPGPAGMHVAIWDVLIHWVASETWVDLGAPGVDLADFFAGWVCRNWGTEDDLRALLENYRAEDVWPNSLACD